MVSLKYRSEPIPVKNFCDEHLSIFFHFESKFRRFVPLMYKHVFRSPKIPFTETTSPEKNALSNQKFRAVDKISERKDDCNCPRNWSSKADHRESSGSPPAGKSSWRF